MDFSSANVALWAPVVQLGIIVTAAFTGTMQKQQHGKRTGYFGMDDFPAIIQFLTVISGENCRSHAVFIRVFFHELILIRKYFRHKIADKRKFTSRKITFFIPAEYFL